MYFEFPMENFNRKNPFVIISKHKYDEIVSNLNDIIKMYIKIIIIFSIYTVISIVHYILLPTESDINTASVLILVGLQLLYTIYTIVTIRQKIDRYTNNHDGIISFSKLSGLSMSEVAEISNEDMFNCIQLMNELNGELLAIKLYYPTFFRTISILFGVLNIVLFRAYF